MWIEKMDKRFKKKKLLKITGNSALVKVLVFKLLYRENFLA